MSAGQSRAGQHTGTAAAGPSGPESIRNVVLVGPSGAGKSALFERLVAEATPGYRPRVEQERSTALTAATIESEGVTITLLDTPGYADFVGDLRAGLRAADGALFVVSAADGVDAATQMLWRECEVVGMPRAIAVTRLEHGRIDFDDTVAICRRVFGDCQPLYLPLHGDDGETVVGTLALLSQRLYDASGDTTTVTDAEDEHRELVEGARGELVEAIIAESEDDTLLDRYLEGEEVTFEQLAADLTTAVAAGTFFPVVPVSAVTRAGLAELLELVRIGFPTPAHHPLPSATTVDGDLVEPLVGDPAGPLVAEVVKTSTDQYVGRVSLVRVFNGTLRPETPVHVAGHPSTWAGAPVEGHPDHDVEERVGPLAAPFPGENRPVEQAVAGSIAVVTKLARAETADTLSDPAEPVVVEPWLLPDPLLPVAVHARSKADEDKLATALARVVAEDVTMRLEHQAETHQLVLWTLGQAHVDLLLHRLADRYGVTVEAEPLKHALRETFVTKATGHGRHVKQSGGHGQFAVCDIEVEPLPSGTGFEFVDKVVGGAVPRQFIGSVEKGVRAQMEKGVLAGYPMTDIRVTLVDGKAHSVDSSDMAFQHAGALALREAADAQSVALLEPVESVDVVVSDDVVGAVMSDLSARRGRVLGQEPSGSGRTVVHAEVPAVELARYAIDLRSVSHGTGSFSRSPARYERMPQHLAVAQLNEK